LINEGDVIMDVEEGELSGTGARWIVMGDKVIVDPKYLDEYRKSRHKKCYLRRMNFPIMSSIAIIALAYAAAVFGCVSYGLCVIPVAMI